jgi:hypothetical protein
MWKKRARTGSDGLELADGRARTSERADGLTGERADGRTGWRADGRTGGRADGRTGGRADGRTGGRAFGYYVYGVPYWKICTELEKRFLFCAYYLHVTSQGS